jgi:hypothetical protein
MFLLYVAAVGTGIFLLYNSSMQIAQATKYAEPSYGSILDLLKSVRNMSEQIQMDFRMQSLHIASLKAPQS